MHYALDTVLGMAMGGGALVITARALWPSAFDGARVVRGDEDAEGVAGRVGDNVEPLVV